jgi:hypothetical protein
MVSVPCCDERCCMILVCPKTLSSRDEHLSLLTLSVHLHTYSRRQNRRQLPARRPVVNHPQWYVIFDVWYWSSLATHLTTTLVSIVFYTDDVLCNVLQSIAFFRAIIDGECNESQRSVCSIFIQLAIILTHCPVSIQLSCSPLKVQAVNHLQWYVIFRSSLCQMFDIDHILRHI